MKDVEADRIRREEEKQQNLEKMRLARLEAKKQQTLEQIASSAAKRSDNHVEKEGNDEVKS